MITIDGASLKQDTLEQVEWKWKHGLIKLQALLDYLHAWNTTSFRFTEAYLSITGEIRQRERE